MAQSMGTVYPGGKKSALAIFPSFFFFSEKQKIDHQTK
jgi:hypothetical protein